MLRKIKSIQGICILLIICQSISAQTETITETRIIKGFLPIIENNQLAGFFMIAAQAEQPTERSYYITKCDVNLKVAATFVEKRKLGDEVSSIAYNHKALCVVYASKGQNEFVLYDPQQLTVIKRHKPLLKAALYDHMGIGFSSVHAIANKGFFYNKYTEEGKTMCHFVGFDNLLRQTWEFRSHLGFEDQNVMPIRAKLNSEKYFASHIMKQKNVLASSNRNPSVIINNAQNGALVLHNTYDSPEELVFVGHPEMFVSDTTDMAYLVGDYVQVKSKARGWVLSKMDLKNKTKTNQFITFNDPKFIGYLDSEYQDLAEKNHLGLFPYAIQKFGDGYVVVGEIYQAKPKNIIDFGLTNPQDGYSQSVFFCELDKDFNIVALKYADVADHKVNVDGKDSRYNTAFNGSILDSKYDAANERIELLYLQESSEKQVEYCKFYYNKDQTIAKPLKKPFKRSGANEQLNIFEGKDKFTVFRMNRGLLEMTQE